MSWNTRKQTQFSVHETTHLIRNVVFFRERCGSTQREPVTPSQSFCRSRRARSFLPRKPTWVSIVSFSSEHQIPDSNRSMCFLLTQVLLQPCRKASDGRKLHYRHSPGSGHFEIWFRRRAVSSLSQDHAGSSRKTGRRSSQFEHLRLPLTRFVDC